jgi:putative aldouronate transport system substrate-binding protein
MVAYLNKLHKEGLLDNESFAQSSQQLTAKGNSGNLGVFDSGGGAFTIVGTDKNDHYTLIPPLLSPSNSTLIFPKKSNLIRGLFSITNKNKAPEATMRWIDYLYTDEGSVLAVFGKENEGWKWLDAGKTSWERVTPQGMQPEEYRGGKVTPDAGVSVPTIRLQDFLAKRANSGQIGQVDVEVDNKIIKHWKESFPLVYFKEAEQTRVNILEADMKPYIEQMEAKFITGSESLDNWSKYIDTLKKMGADEYLKLHQDAYDTWKKGNK